MFQSTYLYKVRQSDELYYDRMELFQSTYLYKVRRSTMRACTATRLCFNPRTYIRYDSDFATDTALGVVSIHVPI